MEYTPKNVLSVFPRDKASQKHKRFLSVTRLWIRKLWNYQSSIPSPPVQIKRKGTAEHTGTERTPGPRTDTGGSSKASAPGMLLPTGRVIHSVSTTANLRDTLHKQMCSPLVRAWNRVTPILRNMESLHWRMKYFLSTASVWAPAQSLGGQMTKDRPQT